MGYMTHEKTHKLYVELIKRMSDCKNPSQCQDIIMMARTAVPHMHSNAMVMNLGRHYLHHLGQLVKLGATNPDVLDTFHHILDGLCGISHGKDIDGHPFDQHQWSMKIEKSFRTHEKLDDKHKNNKKEHPVMGVLRANKKKREELE